MTRKLFNMTISRSKQLLIYLTIIHSVILITLLSLLPGTVWSLLCSLFMMFSFIYYCRQYQWLNGQSAVISIARDKDEQWRLFHRNGVQQTQLVMSSCVVTQYFVMLNFQTESTGKKSAITIMADSVDPELFRQLRVYCRAPKTFQK